MLTAPPMEECCPFFALWHIVATVHESNAKENTLQTADFDKGGVRFCLRALYQGKQ